MRRTRPLASVGLLFGISLLLSQSAMAAKKKVSSVPLSVQGTGAPAKAPGDPASWVLDDGAPEDSIGVNGGSVAYQYIWLNLFTPTELPASVNRIDIWWPGGSTTVGNAIQLVVYDSDGTPGTGTTTVTGSQNATIATVGGFDQYALSTPVPVTVGPSMLLGVVDRWVVSGTTPVTYPTALDSTASQGRSWIGWWSTDPPASPNLPTDTALDTIDNMGIPGNFMIRGAGTVLPVELQRFTLD